MIEWRMFLERGDRVVLLDTQHNREVGVAGHTGEVVGVSYHQDDPDEPLYAVMLDGSERTLSVSPDGLDLVVSRYTAFVRRILRRKPTTLGKVLLTAYPVALAAALAVGVADTLDANSQGLGFIWLIMVTFPTNLPLLIGSFPTAQSHGSGVVLAAFTVAGLVQWSFLFFLTSGEHREP